MTDNNKIALITGGTGGIGAAICLKLADSVSSNNSHAFRNSQGVAVTSKDRCGRA
ncbi:MAG: hypothetical protein ACRERV_07390 [Methylococcales bacterium]